MYEKGQFVGYVELPPSQVDGVWHLAMARGGREQAVKEFLSRFGFDVYFPMTRIFRVVPLRQLSRAQRANGAKMKKAVLRPVFPGYVFVRFDPSRAWRTRLDAAGVRGLVCNGDLPAAIPDAMIGNIRDQEVDGAVPGPVLMRQLFQIGETVRITTGPFAQFNAVIEELPRDLAEQLRTGKIEDIDESRRVSLAVHLFGRLTPVSVAISEIAKV